MRPNMPAAPRSIISPGSDRPGGGSSTRKTGDVATANGVSSAGHVPPLAAPVLLIALTLGGVAYFLRAQLALTGNLSGVPLDDAYIHFQFARNLAGGHGFSFNPDHPVPGSTSPLWVLLLAGAGKLGVPLWAAGKIYGTVFLCASAILTRRLALRLGGAPVVALAAGALTALDGRLLWAAPSGMEVTLFAALCLGAMLARPTGSRAGGPTGLLPLGILCALATLTRPEGSLLTAVMLVDVMRRARPAPAALGLAVAAYLTLVAPYNLFSLATTGHILPTTFYAKAHGIGPSTGPGAVRYLLALAYYGLLTNPAALVMAPIGAAILWRSRGEARAAVAWPILLVVLQAVFAPLAYHFGRYAMPLQPFFAVWAVVGIQRLVRPDLSRDAWRAALPPLALVVVGMLTLGTWASVYARSVSEIDRMQVTIGHWVKAHVPPGAAVAMNDIGAITYISERPAVDVVGLVSPHFIQLQRETPASRAARDVYAEVRREGARYLIIFPAWYPDLAALSGLRRVYSVTIDRPIIVGAPTMVVYALAP